MFSLHFNLCNPAINNRGVLVGKWKLFTRSREDIADIRNFHAGNYCITAVTFCILMQRKNLPELLLVPSSGHTVHWEKLLVTCETNLWSKMQPKCGPFGNCGPGRIHDSRVHSIDNHCVLAEITGIPFVYKIFSRNKTLCRDQTLTCKILLSYFRYLFSIITCRQKILVTPVFLPSSLHIYFR